MTECLRKSLLSAPRSPVDSLLGRHGEPVCKGFTEDIAVHWFAGHAKTGDPCLCGRTTKQSKRRGKKQ